MQFLMRSDLWFDAHTTMKVALACIASLILPRECVQGFSVRGLFTKRLSLVATTGPARNLVINRLIEKNEAKQHHNEKENNARTMWSFRPYLKVSDWDKAEPHMQRFVGDPF